MESAFETYSQLWILLVGWGNSLPVCTVLAFRGQPSAEKLTEVACTAPFSCYLSNPSSKKKKKKKRSKSQSKHSFSICHCVEES